MATKPVGSLSVRHWAAALAVAAFAGVAAWVYLGAGRSSAPQSQFVLLDGSRQSLADWRGKVLLVNFWATSCTSCVAEMPALAATYDKYKGRGFDTVAVAMSYDPPGYVVRFAQSRALPFKVALDNTGQLARDWGNVRITPTSFVLNKRGEIVKSYVGAPDFSSLHALLEKLLAEH